MMRQLAKSVLQSYATRVPYHRGKWRVIEIVRGLVAPPSAS